MEPSISDRDVLHDTQDSLIFHIQSPSMPTARRSADPARPMSEMPTLNAALLKTEAADVGAVFVLDPDELPDDVENGDSVVEDPDAVVPVGKTVGLKFLMFKSRRSKTLRNETYADDGIVLEDVEEADVETVAPMVNVAVSANTSLWFLQHERQ